MKSLECGCDYVEATHTLVSICALHGHHVRLAVEAAKHPRSGAAADKELRSKLLVASMPTACERVARGDDPDTVAEQTEHLVDQVLRRLA